jgi:hypothetical protein
MGRVRCTDEGCELQQLLEKNFDLLPGDQIDPDDPRRWLLIKREMPVPDPSTGADRWSIDFFFVDQDAIPTFVECKRRDDTRSRREIVGQMLEYAANGHHYWPHDLLRDLAKATALDRGVELAAALETLDPTDDLAIEAFFERVQENLRQGQLRIVFFLEESPFELRSVVDFLNKQMERSEVLLVEARQYIAEGRRIVAPTLFGYTEQARLIKRSVTVLPTGARRRWDRDSFFADAARRLAAPDVQALTTVYDAAVELGYELTWGTGRERGSYNVKDPALCQRSLLSIYSNGRLSLNFRWLDDSDRALQIRDRFVQLAVERLVLPPGDYREKYADLPATEWAKRSDVIVQLLRDLAVEFRAA